MNPAKKIQSAFATCAALVVLACGALLATPAFAAQMTVAQAGAHASHTQDNRSRAKLSCAECHAPVCAPSGTRNVVFGPLAGAAASYDPATRSCSNVYCHGSAAPSPTWTYVYTPQAPPPAVQCAMCHGYPPSSHDAAATACNGCHTSTVKSDGTIDLAGGKHVDGVLDVSGGTGGSGCASCHGFPPATGAHVAHFGLPGVTAGSYVDAGTLQDRYPGETPTGAPAVYAFGCATCHTVDASKHRNGTVEVVLHEATAPAGSIKARNASTAAYQGAAGTCSGVYCHSSGQATPTYVGTPGWYSGAHLGCAGCHANPPRYPSGGAGSATANSHLDLADDGYEFGHFLGMPGAWHTSKHGNAAAWGAGQNATAITCQTCHQDTTDPSSTGPSGFYWLDTTGNYDLGGYLGARCDSCHAEGSAFAPLQAGRVLPLRHVNGARDVVFDARTTVPAIPWLPAAPNTPTRPYWTTDPGLAGYWPAGLTWNGTTLSFSLDQSAYDPGTKTCTNVACHVAEQQPVWGRPYQYYTNSSATCYTCHPM